MVRRFLMVVFYQIEGRGGGARKNKTTPKKPRLSRLKSADSALLNKNNPSYLGVKKSGTGGIEKVKSNTPSGGLRRRHTVAGADGDGSLKMFFENKDFFKLRAHLRSLVQQHNINKPINAPVAGTPPTGSGLAKMKSSRLFFNMLTKNCSWATESVRAISACDKSDALSDYVTDGSALPEVKEEEQEEINMENFTKRRITVLNDIPPERVCLLYTTYKVNHIERPRIGCLISYF